ncbi:MAG: preprotein translocase subunit SecY [Rhodospirillales bacterium]|nr:preprotein translocase subunit SecY [Rhodospirillales bacterium]
MAYQAEQLASQLNLGAFGKATELKKRLWFTLGALIIYRLGTFIPTPGIDSQILSDIFDQQAGGIIDMFNVFAGGALERMSIFALNVMPYISASIIMQLMTAVSPQLEQLKKEGESGRKKMNQYTRYLTVLLCIVQGYGIAVGLEQGLVTSAGVSAVIDPGMLFRFTTVVSLLGGTMFLLWLGEQITHRGVGNGVSLIIFAGIVASFPGSVAQLLEAGRVGTLSAFAIMAILIGGALLIYWIVWMERAQRRIVVQYPKRQVGNRMFGGESSHLPLKLNTAGVIPAIFASSILLMPATLASFSAAGSGADWLTELTRLLGRGEPLYLTIFGASIVFFCFFYTAVVFNPADTADNLRKNGGFVPGIRPGKNTAEYLDYVLTRLTTVGAIYLTIVCVIPEYIIGVNQLPILMGGTALLICVTVTMDTVSQIQSHLLAHQYEGLIKKAKLKGSRGRPRR